MSIENQEPPSVAIDLNIQEGEPLQNRAEIRFEPAGFWRRVLALFIDASLLMFIVSPFSYLFPFFVMPDLKVLQTGMFNGFFTAFALFIGLNIVLTLIARFFYYGWFYKNKGATPGKMALNLRVFNTETGTYLSYGHTFLREGLLKPYVSGLITFGLGFLLVGIRSDKKGLHDLLCATQVVCRRDPS